MPHRGPGKKKKPPKKKTPKKTKKKLRQGRFSEAGVQTLSPRLARQPRGRGLPIATDDVDVLVAFSGRVSTRIAQELIQTLCGEQTSG